MRQIGYENRSYSTFAFLLMLPLLVLIFSLQNCSATDTLTQSQQLTVGKTLISANQVFELGFFSPGNSGKQYVGIWYKNVSIRRIVWVLNREEPLDVTDSASSLVIGSDKNLRLMDGKQNTVWSTNVSVQFNNSIAMLGGGGEFILKDSISGLILWESFNYPCDTFIPGMMLGMNTKTGVKRFLTSWQTEENPSSGNFVVGFDLQRPPQPFTWNGSKPYWRGGPWDGWKFTGIDVAGEGYANGMTVVVDSHQGTVYLTFNTFDVSYISIMIITSVGSLKIIDWDEDIREWRAHWEAQKNPCDVYGTCGPFGFCDENQTSICACLKGFIPKSIEEWSKGNWTSGCARKTELLCGKNTSSLASKRIKNDGFWKLSKMKLPDAYDYIYDIGDPPGCEQLCLNNCSCVAYAFVAGIGCMIWAQELVDIQQFSLKGSDLFLRLANSELGEEKKRIKLIASLTTIFGIFLLGAFVHVFYRWITNKRGKRIYKLRDSDSANAIEISRVTSQENFWGNHGIQKEASELPMFDFNKILVATNNFDSTNKVGEGGFGPVYKGKLEDGQEIAVKRLSRQSGQGEEEFMSEIKLISKLQHRNLVRLLGCCIEGEEKLLVYEYMKNKSLDTFLFDPVKRVQLHWVKRFNIIQGVARGLLYLHRDSCLRVIHRDLKASNVLLDDDLNPKISDLGLARTFLVTQELVNTQRVVGTIGYMSPEYVVGGIYSEKSDVFSFGVLLLEIVSSKRNTSFDYDEKYLNRLGYAWALWNECRVLELTDEALAESFSPLEVMRCVHVGLLCVQDHPKDRPTMSAIVYMLSSETDLPQPKQPTFTFQNFLHSDLQSESNNLCSVNEVSESVIDGR